MARVRIGTFGTLVDRPPRCRYSEVANKSFTLCIESFRGLQEYAKGSGRQRRSMDSGASVGKQQARGVSMDDLPLPEVGEMVGSASVVRRPSDVPGNGAGSLQRTFRGRMVSKSTWRSWRRAIVRERFA